MDIDSWNLIKPVFLNTLPAIKIAALPNIPGSLLELSLICA